MKVSIYEETLWEHNCTNSATSSLNECRHRTLLGEKAEKTLKIIHSPFIITSLLLILITDNYQPNISS